jgi:hypothetical protein
MIAQLLLSALLGCVLVHGWAQYRRSPAVAGLSIVAGLLGLYFVWAPQQTTSIAETFGIGRGVDLILYLWVCISLNLLLSLYLKLRTQQEAITKLARAMALANVITGRRRDDEVTAAVAEAPALVPGDAHMSTQTRGQTA